jgi:nicotinate-nucleotide adenylyltransferase
VASRDAVEPIPLYGDRRRARIGLLGGSFNPAHEGHRHVAETALWRLQLDAVWLLVSPGNPLKGSREMASLDARLASVRRVVDGRRIVPTSIEQRLRTRFTVDTIKALRRRFPRVRFVWLMGADIVVQLTRWRRWREIVSLVPFAVLPRPSYNHRALASRALHRLSRARLPARAASRLADACPPAWIFLPTAQHAASATAIRAARKGGRP